MGKEKISTLSFFSKIKEKKTQNHPHIKIKKKRKPKNIY